MIVPRRRGRRFNWGGMGQVSPVGYADFNSFQNAVIAANPMCPPPFDPTCENARDAAISADLATWATTQGDCRNVVCDAAGQPAVSYQDYTNSAGQAVSGPGYNTTSGFVPTGQQVAVASQAQTSAFTAPAVTSPAAAINPRPTRIGPQVGTPPPTPIQSASPTTAPGGVSAPVNAPTPIQTQTAPTTIYDMTGATTAPTATDFLSAIPWWGWGAAAVVVLMAVSGGKR